MCLNQILQNEQVTLMRHAAADDAAKTRPLRRKLNMFQKMLQEHPYAHRPYAPINPSEGPLASNVSQSSGLISGLTAWENEGGHVAMARSQQRGSRKTRNPRTEEREAALKLPVSHVEELMTQPKGKL